MNFSANLRVFLHEGLFPGLCAFEADYDERYNCKNKGGQDNHGKRADTGDVEPTVIRSTREEERGVHKSMALHCTMANPG